MSANAVDVSPLMSALAFYVRERSAAVTEARKRLGINELDAKAVTYVAAHPGARPSDLRAHLGVTAAGVTTLVERLVQRQVLRRELDEHDRRVNHIYVTVDLERAPWSQLSSFDDSCREFLSVVDPQAAAAFAATLTHATLAGRKGAVDGQVPAA